MHVPLPNILLCSPTWCTENLLGDSISMLFLVIALLDSTMLAWLWLPPSSWCCSPFSYSAPACCLSSPMLLAQTSTTAIMDPSWPLGKHPTSILLLLLSYFMLGFSLSPLMVSKDLFLSTKLPTALLPPALPPPGLQRRKTRLLPPRQ